MYARTLGTLSLALAMAFPGAAQDTTTRAPRTAPAPSAETALRLRQELELTEEQVSQLDALRREALATRQAHMAQMMELRSRQLAGELALEEWRAEMAERRDEARERAGALGERVGGVLTDAQRERLSELRRQEWRQQGRMGRAGRWEGGRIGPHMRGPRGSAWGGPGAGSRWDRMPRDGMGPRGWPPSDCCMRPSGSPPSPEG